MVQLTFLDWLWMALFLALMVGCGVFFYRLGKRSESDFCGELITFILP